MNKYEIKTIAKELRKKHWGTFLLSEVLLIVIKSIPLIGLVAAATVNLGKYENYYNAVNKKPVSWKRLYSKFDKQFESSFLYALLFAIVEFVIYAIAAVIVLAVVTVLSFLFRYSVITPIIISIIIIIAVALVVPSVYGYKQIGLQLLVTNQDMTGNEALRITRIIGKGYAKVYSSLFWSFFGGILLSVITGGLYLIKVGPEIQMAYTILTDGIIQKWNRDESKVGHNDETSEKMNITATENRCAVVCNNCGTLNEKDALFCEKCGISLKQDNKEKSSEIMAKFDGESTEKKEYDLAIIKVDNPTLDGHIEIHNVLISTEESTGNHYLAVGGMIKTEKNVTGLLLKIDLITKFDEVTWSNKIEFYPNEKNGKAFVSEYVKTDITRLDNIIKAKVKMINILIDDKKVYSKEF